MKPLVESLALMMRDGMVDKQLAAHIAKRMMIKIEQHQNELTKDAIDMAEFYTKFKPSDINEWCEVGAKRAKDFLAKHKEDK